MAGSLYAAGLTNLAITAYRASKQGTLAANPGPHYCRCRVRSSRSRSSTAGSAWSRETLEGPAAAFGWALVVASLLSLWTPGGRVAKAAATTSGASTTSPAGTATLAKKG